MIVASHVIIKTFFSLTRQKQIFRRPETHLLRRLATFVDADDDDVDGQNDALNVTKVFLMGQFQPALVYFRLFLISILKIQNEKSVDGVLLGFKPSAAIW